MKRLIDHADQPLVVVSAPAGYGKTTTLVLWADADPRPFAWVSLDELDDDPRQLLRHVAAVLDVVAPLGDDVVAALRSSGRTVETDLVVALGRAMAACPDLVLVLDDVQLLTSRSARRAVESLVTQVRDGSQVVLCGRTLPALRLARRRVGGMLVDLDASDLALGPDETAALFAHLDVPIDEDDVDRVHHLTEGWAAGVHLAALATRDRGPAQLAALSGRDRWVADYLVEEVVDGLAEDTTDFLSRSAVVDCMSAPLLDELLEIDDAGARLADIERSGNLFLVPLDRERAWFRYHHLFRDVLRDRLAKLRPDEALRLERRASRILEAHGDADAAIRHAVRAGELARAADLTLCHMMALIDRGEVGRLTRWVDLLGPTAVEHHPAAAVALAWSGLATADRSRIGAGMAAAARSSWDGPLADGTPSVAVALAAMRVVAGPEGIAGIVRDCEIVRSGADPDRNPWWPIATTVRGTVASMLDELELAQELLVAALARPDMPSMWGAGSLAHLAMLDLLRDDLGAAERHQAEAMGIAIRDQLHGVAIAIPIFTVGALVAAKAGRPCEAARQAVIARRILASFGEQAPHSRLLNYLILAQAALAVGERSEARAMADEAVRARRSEPDATRLNRELDEVLIQLAQPTGWATDKGPPLTPAQLRVLAYLPTHLSLQEIADELIISRNTAKSHAVAIYRKIGVRSRSDAVAEARRLGLLA